MRSPLINEDRSSLNEKPRCLLIVHNITNLLMSLPKSRLNSLYKDFRPSRALNPDGYIANVATWRSYLIEHFLHKDNSLVFHCGSQFLRKLNEEPYGVPQSIDVVIDELVQEGYLVTLEDFYDGLMHDKGISGVFAWIKSGWKSRKKFTCRKSETSTNYLKEIDLVLKPTLESQFEHIYHRIAKRLMSNATGIADLIYPENDFQREAGFNIYLKNEDKNYDIMMTYLSQYQNVIIRYKSVIKIIAQPVFSILEKSTKSFTENDLRVATLKTSITNVGNQIEKVESELAQYSTMLNKSFQNNTPKEIQKEYLLAQKIAQKYLTKLLNYRNKLGAIETEINLASTNAMVVGSLDDSKEILKLINESLGSIDSLHVLLSEIEEQKDKTEEINKLLTVDETINPNDDEIEKELQVMIDKQDAKIESELSNQNKENLLERLSHLEITTAKGYEKNALGVTLSVNSNSNITSKPAEKQPVAEI